MDYLIIIGIVILIIVVIGFYIFYCRLNDNNLRVKELERNVRIIEKTEKDANTDTGICKSDKSKDKEDNESKNKDNANNKIDKGNKEINESNDSIHGNIVNEKRIPINICANSEPSECTNYGPIPDEIDNVSIHNINMENMSEFPTDSLF